jgi:tetratricopeptide (TPR) repeat protein
MRKRASEAKQDGLPRFTGRHLSSQENGEIVNFDVARSGMPLCCQTTLPCRHRGTTLPCGHVVTAKLNQQSTITGYYREVAKMRFIVLALCLLQVTVQLSSSPAETPQTESVIVPSRSPEQSEGEAKQSSAMSDVRGLQWFTDVSYSGYVDRWAIIVGISKYKDKSLNLQYAAQDAEALYQLLQTPSGGGFEKDHIVKRINDEATTANITHALRSFLKKPAKNDLVLIYFACHGAPDPDRPQIVYLLTYDTDPKDIAGTALPMREIDLSLKENLLAERAVIIADTCHSAAIGGGVGRRSGIDNATVVNRYLQNVGKAKGGTALLTSAEASETSREGEEWGGGHGVFTHFLLSGMRGDADNQPKDGIVTVGELFDYVRENVKKATGDLQHPAIGPNQFDRNLPMAVTGGITAQEHFQLGCQLYDLGWLLDDKKRFESANRQFYEAPRLARLAGVPFPEANLQLGLSLMALGKHDEAIQAFQKAIEEDTTQKMPEASFYLGIAYAKKKDYQAAVDAFERFLKQRPQDENAPWVGEYVGWLKKQPTKYALLIGIGQYADDNIPALRGPLNDVQLMKEALIGKYGFQESNIVILLDEKATRQGILTQLDILTTQVRPNDVVVVCYSGHQTTSSKNNDIYLSHDTNMAHDTNMEGWSNVILGEELHNLINRIPTTNKTVILDPGGSQLLTLAEREGSYALFTAASPGQYTIEGSFEQADKHIVAGLFTYHFAQQLQASNPVDVTYGQIIRVVSEKVKEYRDSLRGVRAKGSSGSNGLSYDSGQTPQFIGNKERILFTGVEDYAYLTLFDFSLRKNYNALTQFNLQRYASLLERVAAPFPQASYSLGRAYLEKGSYPQAIEALQTAVKQRDGNFSEATLALGFAQVGDQHYTEALANFQKYLSSVDSPALTAQMQEPITLVESFVRGQKHALLVGINDYINPEVTDLRGAENDVLALKEVLLDKFDFREPNIKVLLNHQATRQAILQTFQQLVEKANQGELALFYFAGNGSDTTQSNEPVIVPADGRQAGIYDIALKELSSIAPDQNANLITIIDASFTKIDGVSGTRAIPEDNRPRQNNRDFQIVPSRRNVDSSSLKIGRFSIYTENIQYIYSGGRVVELDFSLPDTTEKRVHGELTYALVQSLEETDSSNLTYDELLKSISAKIQESSMPIILGDTSQKIFSDQGDTMNRLLPILRKVEQAETLDAVIKILPLIIERRNGIYPEGYLNLGIAYAQKGEYDKSIKALETAIVQQDRNYYPEARYNLGRVLFESGRNLARAVDELRQATEQEPDNIPAYYYLGQAIRALVERETLVEARKALQTYLDKGAPLGHREEVQKFLKPMPEPELPVR